MGISKFAKILRRTKKVSNYCNNSISVWFTDPLLKLGHLKTKKYLISSGTWNAWTPADGKILASLENIDIQRTFSKRGWFQCKIRFWGTSSTQIFQFYLQSHLKMPRIIDVHNGSFDDISNCTAPHNLCGKRTYKTWFIPQGKV